MVKYLQLIFVFVLQDVVGVPGVGKVMKEDLLQCTSH